MTKGRSKAGTKFSLIRDHEGWPHDLPLDPPRHCRFTNQPSCHVTLGILDLKQDTSIRKRKHIFPCESSTNTIGINYFSQEASRKRSRAAAMPNL